jgi:UDP-3-O-[3-hydroxymyristoyl] glucosamine N-acyltransferase
MQIWYQTSYVLVYIGSNVVLGDNVQIYPNCFIGDNVVIGDNVTILLGPRFMSKR